MLGPRFSTVIGLFPDVIPCPPDSDLMRRIGTFSDEPSARQFADYLASESIDATIDSDSADPADDPSAAGPSVWHLWIRHENDVARSKEALTAFRANPESAQFKVDVQQLVSPVAANSSAAKQTADVAAEPASTARKLAPSASQIAADTQFRTDSADDILLADEVRQQRTPVTIAIIVLSVIISFTTNFGSPRGSAKPGELSLEQRVYRELSFVDRDSFDQSGGNPFTSIVDGQVWRWVTPMFLHGDEFHLAFNMLGLFFLGSTLERLQGSFRFLILVLVSQVAGMLLQVSIPPYEWLPATLHGSPFAIGASGAVYGLFGFLWIRPLIDRDYPIHLDPIVVVMMLGFLVACMMSWVPNVANGAHLGGLLGGVVVAVVGYILSPIQAKP
ncbi:Rhomboid protease GluP [Rubripirellula lacrimiformis]|uniref:Rhomboid protease GluP n=1 Tax=Rubripirellula lacrimiformis TaxID=1930273 RepID=A0A517N3L6_9BACT|nr:rhomboid family intramembrane serine protease [Rubripirellula lacrimiformis]QDT01729.1 Rhomboid protease GluP [Rubripirellula lacrimiformis]